jgi:glycerophosphoryl diester phosphodiesterase
MKNILLSSIIILLQLNSVGQNCCRDFKNNTNQGVTVIAHRGASAAAPENTIEAVEKALEMNVDFVEIDIHLSKDNKVVVIHDATLDRTTNGTGAVADFTLEELRKLNASYLFDSVEFETQIPTLEEVIDAIGNKAFLLLEIKKGKKHYYEGIEKEALRILKEKNYTDRVIMQSFYDPIIKNWRALDQEIPVHKLMLGNIRWLPIYIDHKVRWGSPYHKISKLEKVSGININSNFAKQKTIDKIKRKGFSTYIWTVNSPEMMLKLRAKKVSGIITNYPDRLIGLK